MKTDNDVKKRILEYAEAKFLKKGFSRVTTDDIAREVGISKRTLYENFASKEEILTELIRILSNRINKQVRSVLEKTDLNLSEKGKLITELYNSYLFVVDKDFLDDVKKFSPKSLAKLSEISHNNFDEVFFELSKQALDEKLIRDDVPIDLIALLFKQMQNVIAQETMVSQKYSYKEISEVFYEILTYGILTDKARAMRPK